MNQVLENIYTREKFIVGSNPATKTVDGVEYIQATKQGTTRSVMIRKDSLRKVEKTTK